MWGEGMKTREVCYNDEKSLIVYLTEQEKDDCSVLEQIRRYRTVYRNVVTFVSGDGKIENALDEMIKCKASA